MNKNIRRIIAMTLMFSAFCTVIPERYFNYNVAYASSDDDDKDEDAYISGIKLSEGKVHFSKKKTSYTVKLDSDIKSVTITVDAENSTDKIKIDGSVVDLDSSKKAKKTVDLNRGRNLIKIRVENDDSVAKTYNLVLNRGSASSSSSSKDDLEDLFLNNIILSDGKINFSKTRTSYEVNVDSSVDEIRVTAEPEYDDHDVKIDGLKVDNDDKYRRTIKLLNGKNTISISLEDEDGNEKIYTVNVNRGGIVDENASELIDETQDPIYLDDIVIDDGDVPIKFKPKVTSYAVDVKESDDYIIIKAEPEYDDMIRINMSKAEYPYRKKVELKKGKNVIEIKVNNSNTYDKKDDEYEERIYKVTVYRGTSQGSAVSELKNEEKIADNNSLQNIDINKWVNSNGTWKYVDITGNVLKNTWYFDKNYGKSYYLKEDGTMATGWILNNGKWYYLDNSGALQTGWKQINYNWYYLDGEGKMKTGWFKDLNGKWYFLYDSTGAMAVNTTIDGYKIGSNGVML